MDLLLHWHCKYCKLPGYPKEGPLPVEEVVFAERHWIRAARQSTFAAKIQRLEEKCEPSTKELVLNLCPLTHMDSFDWGYGKSVPCSYHILLITVLYILPGEHAHHDKVLSQYRSIAYSAWWSHSHCHLIEWLISHQMIVRDHQIDYVHMYSLSLSSTSPHPQMLSQIPVDHLTVSLSVKAIHLELVSDLTTAAFLAALWHFVVHRSKPSIVWSDTGLNLVIAAHELKDFLYHR